MGDMEAFAHELMQERYFLTVEALKRCIKAGAKQSDIETLCRETGVNIKDVIVEKAHATAHR